VGAVELVGENFFFGTTGRALAAEGFEVLEAAESGAMLGCGLFLAHKVSSFRFMELSISDGPVKSRKPDSFVKAQVQGAQISAA
jgi:hypothetical protein